MVVREVVRVLSGERAEPDPLKGSRECRHIHRHSRFRGGEEEDDDETDEQAAEEGHGLG